MTCSRALAVLVAVVAASDPYCHGFSKPISCSSRISIKGTNSACRLAAVNEEGPAIGGGSVTVASPPSSSSSSSLSESATKRVGINSRGAKMNEIDFTLAPSDVSLSRCYQMSKTNNNNDDKTETPSAQSLSLTQALNTASNRAVRRILLARSWPSAEALNLSLRTVLMQQQQKEKEQMEEEKEDEEKVVKGGLFKRKKKQEEEQPQQPQSQQQQDDQEEGEEGGEEGDKAKCPVPRPILNILMNRKDDVVVNDDNESSPQTTAPVSSEEREQRWIQNQIADFRTSYSSLPGYDQAEAYLESILYLATSGEESVRVAEVMAEKEGGGMSYVEPYQRVLSVIQSVGAALEEVQVEGTETNTGAPKRRRIAKKLIDQDICLSMLDKISLANERREREAAAAREASPLAIPYDAAARLAYEADPTKSSNTFEDFKANYVAEAVAMVSAKKKQRDDEEMRAQKAIMAAKVEAEESEKPKKGAYEKGRRSRLAFWSRKSKKSDNEGPDEIEAIIMDVMDESNDAAAESATSSEPEIVIKPDDLGGVLLSAEEPTMTRQLNALSNIVQRTLIFGGDQELLVLAETLDADKPAFVQRWYGNDNTNNKSDNIDSETQPGVQYLSSLVRLLRDCYAEGVLTEISPALPLTPGYRNAYGRLTASLVERGSGYVRPAASSPLALAMTTSAATAKYLTSTAPPKTAREELDRFAKWETSVRKNRENPYPYDLVGTWNVQDVVGTQTIGTTEVTFKPQGELSVKPPMQGLRWRLDPGPTHLDTCTFQVLSDDGAILQYKGFVDRGSRLEARVSKRSVTMRGGVSFLMRDAEGGGGGVGDNYWDDMVPMNYKSGATKFIMSRNKNGGDEQDYSSSASSAGPRVSLKCPAVAEGEREILNGPKGPILVTRVAGSYYAVDATCPHLGLPMKKGKITASEGGGAPTLTCSFHNSCFEMKKGKCTKWVTGALGKENELISGVMSNLGSEQKDIVAYHVSEEEDGSLVVTSEVPEVAKITA